MITASFFIFAPSLPPPRSGQRLYRSLALTLLDGDAKNDRQSRHIQHIAVSNDEQKLVSHFTTMCCASPTSTIAILGFTHRYANAIKAIAVKVGASLIAINAPGQRHPAAIVAVADRTMRVRSHHLYYSDGRSAPLSAHTTCESDALIVF